MSVLATRKGMQYHQLGRLCRESHLKLPEGNIKKALPLQA
jgi:hypothetical protein